MIELVLTLEKRNVVWIYSKPSKESSLSEITKRSLKSGCRSVVPSHYKIPDVNFFISQLFNFAINLLSNFSV